MRGDDTAGALVNNEAVPRLGSGIPLVARTVEMRQLRAALDRARDGQAGAVVLSGDAGVGKTRVVTEFAGHAAAQDALVLTGHCLDVREAGLPYLPFTEALAGAAPDVLRRWPALGRLLPQLTAPRRGEAGEPAPAAPPETPGPRTEQDVSQLQLFDAVFGVLEELAAQRVVVLVVEDLHWADSSTRNLLSFLLSRLRGQRLLVLATYRADDLHRRHPLRALLAELVRLPPVERVELEPFSPEETREFLDALAERPLDEATVRDVVERSEGNAFFAEELLGWCGTSDALVPSGLADVLLARLERLGPAAQTVLRVVAVAGRSVSHAQLAEVAPGAQDELEEALRDAVQHQVLVTRNGRYAFRHALLREAVYQDLLPGERTRLHADYAAVLSRLPEDHGYAATLAYHSMQSNDLGTALTASARAATEADWSGAPAEALRHVEQALGIWDAVDPRQRGELTQLDLLHHACWAAAKAGEPERALSYARAAVDALTGEEEPELAAKLWRRLAQSYRVFDNRDAEAQEAIRQAWTLVADRAPSGERSWVLAIKAALERLAAQPGEARESARQAVADARATGTRGSEADATVTLAILDEGAGDVAGARTCLRDAIRISAAAEVLTVELRAWYYLGLTYYERGELTEALPVFADGMRRARATGLAWSSHGVELRVLQAVAMYASGQWTERAALPDGDWMGRSSLVPARLAAARSPMLAGLGRFDELDGLLAELRTQWQWDVQIALFAGCAGAESALWQGDPQRALAWVDEALDWQERFERWALGGIRLAAFGVRGCTQLAALRQRASTVDHQPDDAGADLIARGERYLEHARGAARNGRRRAASLGPEGQAWLALAEAEATQLREPDPDAWLAAVRAFDYGAVYEQAICRLGYAEALLATGPSAARPSATGTSATGQHTVGEQLRAASAAAESLGARPLREAIKRLAARVGVELAGHPRPADNSLTPRERAVLAQVALGRTNREAGEQLYISEKTVSVHLSRVMHKLGASRRAEAVAIAAERGLLDQGSEQG